MVTTAPRDDGARSSLSTACSARAHAVWDERLGTRALTYHRQRRRRRAPWLRPLRPPSVGGRLPPIGSPEAAAPAASASAPAPGGGKLPAAEEGPRRPCRGQPSAAAANVVRFEDEEDDDDEEEDEAEDPVEFPIAPFGGCIVGRPISAVVAAQGSLGQPLVPAAALGVAAVAEVMPPRTVTADNRCNARCTRGCARCASTATKEERRGGPARDSRRAAAAAAAARPPRPADRLHGDPSRRCSPSSTATATAGRPVQLMQAFRVARRTMAVRFQPPKSRPSRPRRARGEKVGGANSPPRCRRCSSASTPRSRAAARGRLSATLRGSAASARSRDGGGAFGARVGVDAALGDGAAGGGGMGATTRATRRCSRRSTTARSARVARIRSARRRRGPRRATRRPRARCPPCAASRPTVRRALRALGARPRRDPRARARRARARAQARRGRDAARRARRAAGGRGRRRRRLAARGGARGDGRFRRAARAAASLLAVERVVRFRKCMALTDFVRHVARDVDPRRGADRRGARAQPARAVACPARAGLPRIYARKLAGGSKRAAHKAEKDAARRSPRR